MKTKLDVANEEITRLNEVCRANQSTVDLYKSERDRLRAGNLELVAALQGVHGDLAAMEWGSADHAQDLLHALIKTHEPKLRAAAPSARTEDGASWSASNLATCLDSALSVPAQLNTFR